MNRSSVKIAAASRASDAWIWGPRVDLSVFAGSAAVALALCAATPWLSPGGELPAWGWIVFVLAIDVAHVWSTLFRTYLDGEELRRRRSLYLAVPLACYAIGVALHSHDAATFWRVLAYVAVFHFVRQQIGWVAIYRVRNGEREPLDRRLDEAVVYAATGWPLLYWHAHLPRAFHWLAPGDFADGSLLRPLVGPLAVGYAALIGAYAWRAVVRARRDGRVNWGKHVVVATTALIWLMGIVVVDHDFGFTITNVTVHGIPYFALLWAYTRERGKERPASAVGKIAGHGIGAFLAVALAFAFFEEMAWDRLVWHERPAIFGGALLDEPLLGTVARSLIVPLLALPQAVHYALDGLLWRSRDAGPAQARALGFARS